MFAVLLDNVDKQTLDYMTPPEEERVSILKDAHEFGHFGSEALVKEIHSNGLHWKNLYKETAEIVKACPECQKHNISKRGFHPMRPIMAFLPFDHIGFDLAGPLPVTNETHNVYLMVVVDICTKYVILRALPNKQSDAVAQTLINIFGDYGFPRIMQSDNGTEFKNSLMHEISKNLGIDRRYSSRLQRPSDKSEGNSTISQDVGPLEIPQLVPDDEDEYDGLINVMCKWASFIILPVLAILSVIIIGLLIKICEALLK